jgi:hypothetical protein
MSSRYLSKDNPIPREEFGPLPEDVVGNRRKEADEEARRDLTKSYEQLVADAHEEISDPNRSPEQNLGYSNRRLASIFARAAMESEKSARENINLQTEVRDLTRRVNSLTKLVVILSVVMVILALISAYPAVKDILKDMASFLSSVFHCSD